MVFDVDVELVAFIGIFIGCLARMLLPFFKKLNNGEIDKFELRYLATVPFALIAATLLFPMFDIPAHNIWPVSFGFGWAAQDIINGLIN